MFSKNDVNNLLINQQKIFCCQIREPKNRHFGRSSGSFSLVVTHYFNFNSWKAISSLRNTVTEGAGNTCLGRIAKFNCKAAARLFTLETWPWRQTMRSAMLAWAECWRDCCTKLECPQGAQPGSCC